MLCASTRAEALQETKMRTLSAQSKRQRGETNEARRSAALVCSNRAGSPATPAAMADPMSRSSARSVTGCQLDVVKFSSLISGTGPSTNVLHFLGWTSHMVPLVYMLVIIDCSSDKTTTSVPTYDYTLLADIRPVTTLGIKIPSPSIAPS